VQLASGFFIDAEGVSERREAEMIWCFFVLAVAMFVARLSSLEG
jgi:hypothetical protein